nr:MAG TPA: hypothetical protein [Caudoviricetes sp.]
MFCSGHNFTSRRLYHDVEDLSSIFFVDKLSRKSTLFLLQRGGGMKLYSGAKQIDSGVRKIDYLSTLRRETNVTGA